MRGRNYRTTNVCNESCELNFFIQNYAILAKMRFNNEVDTIFLIDAWLRVEML